MVSVIASVKEEWFLKNIAKLLLVMKDVNLKADVILLYLQEQNLLSTAIMAPLFAYHWELINTIFFSCNWHPNNGATVWTRVSRIITLVASSFPSSLYLSSSVNQNQWLLGCKMGSFALILPNIVFNTRKTWWTWKQTRTHCKLQIIRTKDIESILESEF